MTGPPATRRRANPAHRAVASPLSGGQLVAFELLAQLGLEDLARGAMRDGLDEVQLDGQPILDDLALEEYPEFVLGDLALGATHHDQKWPLVPLGMLHADHRRLGDAWTTHGGVLQVDRADPFAARFDDVLGAVGDHDGAI